MSRSFRLALVLAIAGLRPDAPGAAASAEPPMFVEAEAESGLDFVHFNGAGGALYFPEIMGAGAALLDYDGDGDLDAYLVQGAMLPPGTDPAGAPFPPAAAMLPLGDRLYRNDLVPAAQGGARPRFVDVTAASGLAGATGFGMGVAVGDVDGDGRPDLYVTNFGPNQLFRNRGDGTFEEVTAAAGVGDRAWSVAATFLDYDRDGDADLYVANYVRFSLATHVDCFSPTSARDYCGPLAYPPAGDRLYRNRGDGTFEEVTAAAGLGAAAAGLGVIAADLDGDGWADLYVANDQMPNHLWRNRGDGTFEETALLAGCALSDGGRAEASMGIAPADLDGDGDLELLLTHLAQETNTLYLGEAGGLFRDATLESGLGGPSFPFTGFGVGWLDLENDGDLDLAVVNGEVKRIESLAGRGDPFPFHQPNQLFVAAGGRYAEVAAARAGAGFARSEVSRGLVLGDVDGDGDTDLLVSNNNGPARLLLNQVGQDAGWIAARPLDRAGGDADGARARLATSGGETRWRRAHRDGSYASASEPVLRFGIGAGRPTRLTVHWPDGAVRGIAGPAAGRLLILPASDGSP